MVITDLGLEGAINGLGLADIIKNESLSSHVILLTASAEKISQDNTSAQLKEKGVDHLMGKPFEVMELMNYVKGLKNPQA